MQNTKGPLSLKAINITLNDSKMSKPRKTKYRKYERYFLKHKEVSHPIIIDEQGFIRAGYISYLIAFKYGVDVDVYIIHSSDAIEKHVIGCHVVWNEHEKKYRYIRKKMYEWNYGLSQAVVPGDILYVQTQKGDAPMIVKRVMYVAAKESAERMSVIKHIRTQKQPDKRTNVSVNLIE